MINEVIMERLTGFAEDQLGCGVEDFVTVDEFVHCKVEDLSLWSSMKLETYGLGIRRNWIEGDEVVEFRAIKTTPTYMD